MFVWIFPAGAQPYPAAYQLENPAGGFWANMAYRLYFTNGTTIVRAPDEVEVINHRVLHGVTDKNGSTPVILLDKLPELKDVVLIRRVGRGNYGVTMLLEYSVPQSEMAISDVDEKKFQRLTNRKYTVKICNQKKRYGITDKNGQTYYYMSPKPCLATIYVE